MNIILIPLEQIFSTMATPWQHLSNEVMDRLWIIHLSCEEGQAAYDKVQEVLMRYGRDSATSFDSTLSTMGRLAYSRERELGWNVT